MAGRMALGLTIAVSAVLRSATASAESLATAWADYNADDLTYSDGDSVTAWADSSGNSDHDLVRDQSGVTFIEDGIDGKPAVYFNSGRMATSSGVATPSNGQVTAMIMFSSTGSYNWEQLIGQGHDQYWVVRQYSSSSYMTMHVENSNSPITSFSQSTEYVVVARTDGGYRDISIYTLDGSLYSSASDTDSDTIASETNSDTEISMGWSKSVNGNEQFVGYIRRATIWDSYLSDDDVSTTLTEFMSPSPTPVPTNISPVPTPLPTTPAPTTPAPSPVPTPVPTPTPIPTVWDNKEFLMRSSKDDLKAKRRTAKRMKAEAKRQIKKIKKAAMADSSN